MNCLTCRYPLSPNALFCDNCGAPVPPPPSGTTVRGFAVDAPNSIINIGTLGAANTGGISGGDHCPICGKFNPPERTFRCLHCGRAFICVTHQDPITLWCTQCSRRPSDAPSSQLFQLNYEFVYPQLPLSSEALAQVLIHFTSRDDANEAAFKSIQTHLCLVLDVSGSMNTPDKYPLLRQAIPQLIDALSDNDYLTIILFSHGYDVVLSDRISDCRRRVDAILSRIDRSGIIFGRQTLLAPGLRTALVP